MKDSQDKERQSVLQPIKAAYLLITGIPCFIDASGKRWTDALWHKDLVEHVRYLRNFTLAAPVRRGPPLAGAECLSDDLRFATIDYVDLPASDTHLAAIRNWPRTFLSLWRAGARSQLIHAGVADWPIPSGWAATLVAKLRRRTLLINVESAFWRAPKDAPVVQRIRSCIWEQVNRWCVRQADLALFTHHEFAREMLRQPEEGHVFPASWIDAVNVLAETDAKQCWNAKETQTPLRLLFVGRLVREKGMLDLLEAVAGTDLDVHLDVIGAGELAEAVTAAARRGHPVRLLQPLPYGPPFFELLRRYHALVVPSRTDEQPRVIYDAYSQAVPVLASRTSGNLECVADGETGWLVAPASPSALRQVIERAHDDRTTLRKMGMRSLHVASSYTHEEMHRRRHRLLAEVID